MEKYLYCHTTKNPFFTKGNLYMIKEETVDYFLVTCDKKELHKLTKNHDWDGLNFESYMTLETPLNGGVNAPITVI